MRHKISNLPVTESDRELTLPATARWLDASGVEHLEAVTPKLLDDELYLAQQLRTGNRYKQLRNYHGLYFFSQTGRHVWHESLLEATALKWLDMHEEVTAIAAQPFELAFTNGLRHTPDYIFMHADNRQTVVDVKPTKFIDGEKFRLQAAQTRAVCEKVGWGYQVFGSLPKQVEANLSWVAAFKHFGYFPGLEATHRLLTGLSNPIPLIEAVRALGLPHTPTARAGLYNLIWIGQVAVDLAAPINNSTLVRKGPNAHA
ncbi:MULTISPECIES: TnsA-like heteromeric transposase endonuclease subunit [unclassified Cryobacterium]|uniref:TnsA-like heteromeric transposase endonuclease subunit n=1 Tax=unclassified Cryobacterium TaxID=2649013 RepID=UPI00106BB25B|nr:MULTISPECIES: TnsA-like heteromeric transposase endonuclease subunit [unclassified Cryobacterium]TFB95734.1 TnsA-like heteromeric transposase endonuclease subunit [Cryobacterium sp. MDB2-A-1]TFC12048.1 TnsA-like heteromeric transposase endonuclease subunit [Cryobacterium sp. MDB2-A-2]